MSLAKFLSLNAVLAGSLLVSASACHRDPIHVSPMNSASAPKASVARVELNGLHLQPLPEESSRKRSPGFSGASAWLNVDHPLTLPELAGTVVVVDFWTSCCINCLHTLPVLRDLEDRFKGWPVVVVGVHSPKFTAERGQDRLEDILAANDVHHPVAIDSEMKVWDAWHVSGWPTVAVLDTRGRVIWSESGEPKLDELSSVVASALHEGDRTASLATHLPAGLTPRAKASDSPLLYPGKLTSLSDGGIAISDSSHNRIVLLDKEGKVRDIVGTGAAGRGDGDFAAASFRHPEGLVESAGRLFIADTENHLIRVADMKSRTVATVAGTGALGNRSLTPEWADAKTTALRSPWDVVVTGGMLYIAMAGSHQIAQYDPASARIRAFAGSGREARIDGPARSAAFAQPSGLATDATSLFVADSESSSVRVICLASGDVSTLVGEDLFVFGDRDGPSKVARLQHPLGIAYGDGAIWLADTYNNKLKRIDPRSGEVRTLAGDGGHEALFEPGGVMWLDGQLWVADTNRHRVVLVRPSTGAQVAWTPRGLRAPLQAVAAVAPSDGTSDALPVVQLGPVPVGRSGTRTLRIEWELPSGTGINEQAPYKLLWKDVPGLSESLRNASGLGREIEDGIRVAIPAYEGKAPAVAKGSLQLVLCDIRTHRVCVPFRANLEIALAPGMEAKETAVRVKLPEAK